MVHGHRFPAPNLFAPLVKGSVILITAVALGDVTAGLLRDSPEGFTWGRSILAGVTFALAIFLLVAASIPLRAAWLAYSYRCGFARIEVTEGPFRIVEMEGGAWGLLLDTDPRVMAPDLAVVQGGTRGAATAPTDGALQLIEQGTATRPTSRGLRFTLDEGTVALMSHLFDPGEPLRVEWIDWPEELGGPILAHAAAIETHEERRRTRRAA